MINPVLLYNYNTALNAFNMTFTYKTCSICNTRLDIRTKICKVCGTKVTKECGRPVGPTVAAGYEAVLADPRK